MNDRWVSEQLKNRNEIMSLETFYVIKLDPRLNKISCYIIYYDILNFHGKRKIVIFLYTSIFSKRFIKKHRANFEKLLTSGKKRYFSLITIIQKVLKGLYLITD